MIATRNDLVLTDKMVNVELEDSKMINMSVKFFKKASCKAFGISKFSIQSTILLTDKIRQYVERGELNKTYYSIIGQSLNTLPYHAFPTDSGHLLEINTLSDLEVAVKNWAHKIRKSLSLLKKMIKNIKSIRWLFALFRDSYRLIKYGDKSAVSFLIQQLQK